MRNFINIVESQVEWPNKITADDAVDDAIGLHHTPDDFEDGDIAQRIYAFKSYTLTRIPLGQIDNDEYYYDEEDVAMFAARETPFPPILYDPVKKSIIDGTHRVNAAILRGDTHILAYVGDVETHHPIIGESYFGYSVDNPAKYGDEHGVRWLKRKQEIANEKAIGQDDGLRGRKLVGSTTAVMGLNKTMLFPVSVLKTIDGCNSEVRRSGEFQYDSLYPKIYNQGYNMDRLYAVLVGVNHDGEAYVIEGNTRIAVANDMGIEHIPTEFRWFNGGEMVDGLWSPEKVGRLGL